MKQPSPAPERLSRPTAREKRLPHRTDERVLSKAEARAAQKKVRALAEAGIPASPGTRAFAREMEITPNGPKKRIRHLDYPEMFGDPARAKPHHRVEALRLFHLTYEASRAGDIPPQSTLPRVDVSHRPREHGGSADAKRDIDKIADKAGCLGFELLVERVTQHIPLRELAVWHKMSLRDVQRHFADAADAAARVFGLLKAEAA